MDAGDGSAEGELETACVAHQAMLLNHARRFLGDRRDDAQDFVQDTIERFVKAFRSKSPPPEPRCGGWLMTTLTNLLITDWRKQGVRR
ncbi:MAG TPA: sigma factor, partial [Myxococcales bacterium]|nr:sigma factor [Myxococcales bacterium]